jgi:hypothetical protein
MTEQFYRVGNRQPQNVYRGDQYIGVMFSPIDAAAVVRHMNAGLGECTCDSYEPCQGQCCGVGMCSCSTPTDEEEPAYPTFSTYGQIQQVLSRLPETTASPNPPEGAA